MGDDDPAALICRPLARNKNPPAAEPAGFVHLELWFDRVQASGITDWAASTASVNRVRMANHLRGNNVS